MNTLSLLDPGVWIALACFAPAAALLAWFLIASPPLTPETKLLLLLGIAVLPLGGAVSTTYVGFEATTERHFCGGCHVMTPYTDDAETRTSTSLASRHSRNHMFGDQSCYRCHADYGMFGLAVTKLGGLGHVYHYYLGGYRSMPVERFLDTIHIARPFPSSTCTHCHSTETPRFEAVRDHRGALDALRAGELRCASAGCHGPAHPFSKHRPGRVARREGDDHDEAEAEADAVRAATTATVGGAP